MSIGVFGEELEVLPALRSLLFRYVLAFNEELAQTAACNGWRVLDQRLTHWLLMAHDLAERDEFP